jgi:CRISPR-associated endonuclease/helicase Cas3
MCGQNIGNNYYAHSIDGRPREEWERLQAHLSQVADRTKAFAAGIGAAELGYIAGLLHDIGKYSAAFQKKLDGGKGEAPHSIAGAKLAEELYGKGLGRMLAFAIAAHHGGLPDGIPNQERGARTPLRERLNDSSPKACPDYSAYREEIAELPPKPPLPQFKAYPGQEFQGAYAGVGCGLFIRMLFSCLVDADRLATEAFYESIAPGGRVEARSEWASLQCLKPLLDSYLAEKAQAAKPSPVNRKRAEVLAAARDRAQEPPGIFTMTVPTGGGKTLSSLAFALEHAHRHPASFDRVIYVIPFTSIIEQTAQVFRDVLGDNAVLEHHSAFDEDKFLERQTSSADGDFDKDGTLKLRLAAENWDAPLIVTTAVQFFESLFASSAGKCRKLHNIARTIIVLDEAQTLPLPLLRPCIAALDQLSRNYGCTIVLCTATQPALLAHKDDLDRSFRGGFHGVRHIVEEPEALYRELRRVTVSHIGTKSDDELAARLAAHTQALCIVNTRKHARELYEMLGAAEGNYHLSALMCPKHRTERLTLIRARLADKMPCRVVTTTLIEAGVDVDFPVAYRAEMGLDSIAQAAGRCNREGKQLAAESFLYVFKAEGRSAPAELKQYADIASDILAKESDPLMPEAIERYFQEVYWRRDTGRESELDSEGILEDLHTGCANQLWIPFETVSRKFKIIKDGQKPILIPFDDRGRELIETLAGLDYGSRFGDIVRKLQPYIVTVPRFSFAALRQAGAVQPVNEQRFGEQFCALISKDPLYRGDIGLMLDDPTFRSAESNMF